MTVNKIMFGLFKFAKIIITSKVGLNVMDGTDERMPEKYNHFRIHRWNASGISWTTQKPWCRLVINNKHNVQWTTSTTAVSVR